MTRQIYHRLLLILYGSTLRNSIPDRIVHLILVCLKTLILILFIVNLSFCSATLPPTFSSHRKTFLNTTRTVDPSNPMPSLYSVHKRNLETNMSKSDTSATVAMPTLKRPYVHSAAAASVLGIVGSETRRLLKELDRRNSPIAVYCRSTVFSTEPVSLVFQAARRMKLETGSNLSSPRGTNESEVGSFMV